MTDFNLRSIAARESAGIATATTSPVAAPTVLGQPLTNKAAFALAGSALVALSAHVSIPLGFTPVPLTLQPFAVLLLGLLLDPVTAFAALALYLGEGASGLPVFSPAGPGGVAQLLGPTGGDLMAAPVAAAATSLLSRLHRSFLARLFSAAVGDAILLVSGAAWLGMLTHASIRAVAAESIAPFLLTDSIKVLAAAVCAGILLSFRSSKPAR
jgi:biotin transport system substrate-specific component